MSALRIADLPGLTVRVAVGTGRAGATRAAGAREGVFSLVLRRSANHLPTDGTAVRRVGINGELVATLLEEAAIPDPAAERLQGLAAGDVAVAGLTGVVL